MRALTLRQPWAWAICHAGKRIENRTWAPPRSVIGQRIAIHAGSGDDGAAARLDIEALTGRRVPTVVEHGAIVATALVVRAVRQSDSPWYQGPEYVGWELADVRVLAEHVPCRGMLGLWTVPADVATRIECDGARPGLSPQAPSR